MADILPYPETGQSSVSPVFHVCVTCRRSLPVGNDPVQGRQLYDALLDQAAEGDFSVQPVECMAACSRGCIATLSMPEKWTFVLGELGPEKLSDLLAYLQLYRASKTGTVMPSKRPASLSDMVIARLPSSLSASQELS